MARYGCSRHMQGRARPFAWRGWPAFVLASVVGALMMWPGGGQAQSGRKAGREKAGTPAEMAERLNTMTQLQQSMAMGLAQLRDQLSDLQRQVSDGRDAVRENRDIVQGALDQIKGMREEVRGLYVESSGLKGDIARVGNQVEDLDGSLANFRLSAGIVVAVVVVLQIVLVGLTFRGRG